MALWLLVAFSQGRVLAHDGRNDPSFKMAASLPVQALTSQTASGPKAALPSSFKPFNGRLALKGLPISRSPPVNPLLNLNSLQAD